MEKKNFGFYIIPSAEFKAIRSDFKRRYNSNVEKALSALMRDSVQKYKCEYMPEKLDIIVDGATEVFKGVEISNESIVEDSLPVLIGPEQLLGFMESIRRDIQHMYSELLKDADKMREHIKERAQTWKKGKGGLTVYNTSSLTSKLVEDESWEYRIFELTRFFKAIDFNSDYVFFVVRDKVF